ncbi:sensor histidine kinase [Rugosimonospora africana]|uniref:histidine kinase n=1 Tax=Rugosimonospora africana TaxID=556532 RepID=A0A8J3QRN9_9ACTN|nr:sensor histidine kinase [Rugosimonospora africana]GIH15017.1 two-component sensor histidine kinase [Rugosimonospora africana]
MIPWRATGATLAGRGQLAASDPRAGNPLTVYAAAALGLLVAASVLPLKARDATHSVADTVFGGVSGVLFIGAGLLAFHRRRDNPIGFLMVLVGVGWFAEDLQFSHGRLAYTAGLMLGTASNGFLAHLVLAFPTGRLGSAVERWLVGIAYATALGLSPLGVVFVDPRDRGRERAANLLLGYPSDGAVKVIGGLVYGLGAAVAVGIAVVLLRRWFAASAPQRRLLAPVFLTGLVGAVASAASSAAADGTLARLICLEVYGVAFCLLPLGFLAGVLRVRLGRTGVAALLIDLQRPFTPARLRDRLAVALGDRSLRIGYWRPDGGQLVDAEGIPLPVPPPGRVVTFVERDGRRVAGLVHDAALLDDPHVLEAATAAAGLLLDNQRLTAEVRAQLAEVRDSRARIVAAGSEERRRMERDLHDGVQQSVVAAAIGVRMVDESLPPDADPRLRALTRACADSLEAALAELRELVRGMHPAILSELGLVPALESLVERAPVPVALTAPPLPRLPTPVEETAYRVVAEALTNVMKHARANRVQVRVGYDGTVLRVEVVDDGIGGADLAGGSGLLGLTDRVRALDGDLVLRSAPGHGTSVSAVLPGGA